MASDRLRSRWVWITAFAALLLASSAAIGVWEAGDGPDEAPAFETDVSELRESLAGMTGVRRTVIERDQGTVNETERVWRRPGTGAYRTEKLDGPASGAETQVSSGSVLWLYDADENSALRMDLGNGTRLQSPDRLDQLMAIVNRTDAGEPATSGTVSPLPVVPTEGQQASSTAGIAGSLTVTYEGTASVADRETYVFELTSETDTAAFISGFTQRLWLDQEWYVPLKRATEYRRGGENVSITVGYENVTFDSELDPELFQFDSPTNATVTDADRPRQQHFADRAGLRAASSFSIPEPSLPGSFRLVEATRTVDSRVRSIGLQYANETARVKISKSNLTWYEPETEGQTVRVGDSEATLRNLGAELRVSWTCEGVRYSVAGTGVSSEQLIEIAGSVACE